MYSHICYVIPRMKYFSKQEVRQKYTELKKNAISAFLNTREMMLDENYQERLIAMINNPVIYLTNNCCPFMNDRNKQEWAKEEDDFLIKIAKSAQIKISYSFLTFCFPGRNGKEIYYHFLKLVGDQDFFRKC